MNDIVERLRSIMVDMELPAYTEEIAAAAMDAIEQRDATIASLKQERDEARAEAYDLKYAAAGGEDVPGSANAVTVADVERWRREQEARATTAERERDEARASRDWWKGDAELLQGDIASLEKERDEARKALRKIAAWREGPFPETHEDYPAMAIVTAREAYTEAMHDADTFGLTQKAETE